MLHEWFLFDTSHKILNIRLTMQGGCLLDLIRQQKMIGQTLRESNFGG